MKWLVPVFTLTLCCFGEQHRGMPNVAETHRAKQSYQTELLNETAGPKPTTKVVNNQTVPVEPSWLNEGKCLACYMLKNGYTKTRYQADKMAAERRLEAGRELTSRFTASIKANGGKLNKAQEVLLQSVVNAASKIDELVNDDMKFMSVTASDLQADDEDVMYTRLPALDKKTEANQMRIAEALEAETKRLGKARLSPREAFIASLPLFGGDPYRTIGALANTTQLDVVVNSQKGLDSKTKTDADVLAAREANAKITKFMEAPGAQYNNHHGRAYHFWGFAGKRLLRGMSGRVLGEATSLAFEGKKDPGQWDADHGGMDIAAGFELALERNDSYQSKNIDLDYKNCGFSNR